MRERFTELEGEMVQLKEMIFFLQKVQTTDQTNNSHTAKHREKDSLRRELSTLQTEVKELQQEREGLRAQLETLETLFLQQTEIHRAQLTAMRMEIRELRQDRGAQHSEFSSSEEPVEQDTSHPDHSSQTTEIQHSQNPPLPSDTSFTSHSDDPSTPTETRAVPVFAKTLKDVALNWNHNSTPRGNRVQQPPPRPVRKHSVSPERTSRRLPLRQQHSHMLRPSQLAPEHLLPALTSSHSVNQARPKPLLPTPYPIHTQQAPGSHSYAQIVSRKPTGPVQATTTELRDIRQMLNLICSHTYCHRSKRINKTKTLWATKHL
ncbi:hypothetical protein DPX16_22673 [Anabarilius grahami]|uniref:Uncharacterized protein n=1 Tax=Anabarilius grahami TaxID=495550 RepID=A0A3N0XGS1_ANAGA|nr:hypothetical protein DPX16_22673 [Anabarilius grahami]